MRLDKFLNHQYFTIYLFIILNFKLRLFDGFKTFLNNEIAVNI
jgi:hypothetical protein